MTYYTKGKCPEPRVFNTLLLEVYTFMSSFSSTRGERRKT